MSAFYLNGETKIRPGLYNRFTRRSGTGSTSATVGVCAVPIHASWGPFGVTVHDSAKSVTDTYGNADIGNTVAAALALFAGGASKVYVCRLGESDSSAKAGTLELQNTAESPEAVVTITAKYAGTRPLSVSIRDTGIGYKELTVYDGTTKCESFTFASGSDADEAANLVQAAQGSNYITAALTDSATTKTVASVNSASLQGGVNPTVTTQHYHDAFQNFSGYEYNIVTLDTVDSSVQTLLKEWLNEEYNLGHLFRVVLGNPGEDFSDLITNAKQQDDCKILYSGICGWDENDDEVTGYQALCLVAGTIAATPSNESIVHRSIPGIAKIKPFTNAEYETAITSGLLLASYSPEGIVWFDSGINTLMNPTADQDEGWKKNRRVATRFELCDRLNKKTAPLIGKINCDNDGVALFIQYAQGVINEMVNEGKLFSTTTITEDPDKPRTADSAWFRIVVDDIDSLEKGYIDWQFSFTAA